MKIEVVLDGQVVSTRWNIDPKAVPDVLAARRHALRSAIDNNELRISQALRATVDIVDDDARSDEAIVSTSSSASNHTPPKPKSVISFRK